MNSYSHFIDWDRDLKKKIGRATIFRAKSWFHIDIILVFSSIHKPGVTKFFKHCCSTPQVIWKIGSTSFDSYSVTILFQHNISTVFPCGLPPHSVWALRAPLGHLPLLTLCECCSYCVWPPTSCFWHLWPPPTQRCQLWLYAPNGFWTKLFRKRKQKERKEEADLKGHRGK